MRYEIRTSTGQKGEIVQTIDFVGADTRETAMRQVLKTAEQQVIAALVAQGWTPPPGTAGPNTRAWRRQ